LAQRLGRNHPTIRRLRALRREADRRRAEGVFMAEGLHLAREALGQSAPIELALFAPELLNTAEGRALAHELDVRGVPSMETGAAVLASLQDARSPQPILLLMPRPAWPVGVGCGSGALVVVAVGLQDPGNLGSLLRTADAAGATACFVTEGSVDPYHPRAVRASMGSIFRMPVAECDTNGAIALLRRRGLALLGAEAAAGTEYHRCDFRRAAALFFGGEGAGLPPAAREAMDESVRVSMRRGVESLSVGAAAAVVLFEASRQRAAQVPDL
jgi:TrmH family RNA methyltransferase